MSSFKAALSFFLVLLTASCGFSPMYGENAPAQQAVAHFGQIDIANIPDEQGQYLRNMLIDRMYTQGRPQNPKYTLLVNPLHKEVVNMGIRKDATYTRAEMRFNAHVVLIDNATNKPVLERDLRAVGGYNLLDNQFATLVSAESVEKHLLEELSDTIRTELGLYFARGAAQ